MKNKNRILLNAYARTVMVAVLIALFIRSFILEAYRIPTSAMKPVLEPGDTIFVQKWPYGVRIPLVGIRLSEGRMPLRGEVVVFADPIDGKRDYIKRVAGLPGDTVEVKGGKILLNGSKLAVRMKGACGEEVLAEAGSHSLCFEPPSMGDFPSTRVPAGSVFVVGDLRAANPADVNGMRSWGMIARDSLRGRAVWVWLSVEPPLRSVGARWFPQFRFERMFKRVQ